MNLELIDKMPFGKHKGKTVEAIFKENPGYLVWMRQQRKDENADPKFFSPEVSVLLDMAIRDSSNLQSKYKPWDLPIDTRPIDMRADKALEEPTIAYRGWGDF